MAKTWQFEVVGTGTFPIDMLRYDGAFPYQSSDAALIEAAMLGEQRIANDPYRIRLTGHYHAPTAARWRSFGWLVQNVSRY